MGELDALNLVKRHAAEWAVPVHRLIRTEKERSWYWFGVDWYTFTLDTGNGEVVACVHVESATVNRFEYRPADAEPFLLPLWAVFPTYTSVAMGWRQGYGEIYKHKWHAFYRALSEAGKAVYRRRYPPPTDEERCWHGFYELIADKPACGEHPIAEFIIGRVP